MRTDDTLRQLFTTGDYTWSLTYLAPYFEVIGRPAEGLLVVFGAHRTIDGAIKRASAHMDMLFSKVEDEMRRVRHVEPVECHQHLPYAGKFKVQPSSPSTPTG